MSGRGVSIYSRGRGRQGLVSSIYSSGKDASLFCMFVPLFLSGVAPPLFGSFLLYIVEALPRGQPENLGLVYTVRTGQ